MSDIGERLADICEEAARLILPLWKSGLEVHSKADESPVTEADRAAERAMREVLAKHRPDDAIEGEEYGSSSGTSGVTWYLDPVDGTSNTANGLPNAIEQALGLERLLGKRDGEERDDEGHRRKGLGRPQREGAHADQRADRQGRSSRSHRFHARPRQEPQGSQRRHRR